MIQDLVHIIVTFLKVDSIGARITITDNNLLQVDVKLRIIGHKPSEAPS